MGQSFVVQDEKWKCYILGDKERRKPLQDFMHGYDLAELPFEDHFDSLENG